MRCWLHALGRGDTAQIGRTSRAFLRAGCAITIVDSREDLVARLRAADVLFCSRRLGRGWCVLSRCPRFHAAPRAAPDCPRRRAQFPGREKWPAGLEKYGGDFDRWRFLATTPATPGVRLARAEPARRLGQRLAAGDDWSAAWRRLLAVRAFRKIHFSPLDVQSSSRLRVLQVVTSFRSAARSG
jgi:hypothetical protein